MKGHIRKYVSESPLGLYLKITEKSYQYKYDLGQTQCRVVVILVGARFECNRVQRERVRDEEDVVSVVTAACSEDSEQEIVASVFIYCIL